jgi:hypothetical protein
MIAWIRSHVTWLALGGALVLAAASGYLASVALGLGTQQPTRTVTVNIGTGERGPAGPPGPKGDPGPAGAPGAESCPAGYTFSVVVFNAPGGQQTIATCLKS